MAASKAHVQGIIFLFICISAAFADSPTAYELLERYDFPRGILPEGVQSYLLRSDGSFDVYLADDSCEFKVTGYTLRYSRRVRGTAQVGLLTGLKGVSVKVLFLWFPIDEVARSGDQLEFRVGLFSASFPLSNFEECPRCRCGFDCDSAAAAGGDAVPV